MTRLTFANPVFCAYAIAAVLMIVKTMGMAWLTVYRMMRVKAGFRSPEDAKRTRFTNPEPRAEQVGPNEYVDRIRRIHLNDLENVPLFLAAGLLFVLTDPSLRIAQLLFYGYAASRLLHFVAYVTARTHDVRATLWTISSLIVLYMTAIVLRAAFVA